MAADRISVTGGGLDIQFEGFDGLRRMAQFLPLETKVAGRIMVYRLFRRVTEQWAGKMSQPMRRMLGIDNKARRLKGRSRLATFRWFFRPRSGGSDRAIANAVRNVPFSGIFAEAQLRGKVGLIHELGGTVKGKRGKKLSIPTGRYVHGGDARALANELGVKKLRASMIRRAHGRKSLFFKTSSSGKPMIWRKMGDGKIEPVFRLVSSVRLRPRLRLVDTFNRQGRLSQELADDAAKKVRQLALRDFARRISGA